MTSVISSARSPLIPLSPLGRLRQEKGGPGGRIVNSPFFKGAATAGDSTERSTCTQGGGDSKRCQHCKIPLNPPSKGGLGDQPANSPFFKGAATAGDSTERSTCTQGRAVTSVVNTARSPLIPLQKGDFEANPLIAPFSRGQRQRGISLGAQHALKGEP